MEATIMQSMSSARHARCADGVARLHVSLIWAAQLGPGLRGVVAFILAVQE